MWKVLIGVLVCLGLLLTVFLVDVPSWAQTAVILTISIIVTFLGLAYYEEQHESRGAHEPVEDTKDLKHVQKDIKISITSY
jgi:hypothetical protein